MTSQRAGPGWVLWQQRRQHQESSAPSTLIRRGRRAAWAPVPVGQGQVLGAELCSSVPGGVATVGAGVRAGGVTLEVVREQAGAGMS